jgi:hypothetical protein
MKYSPETELESLYPGIYSNAQLLFKKAIVWLDPYRLLTNHWHSGTGVLHHLEGLLVLSGDFLIFQKYFYILSEKLERLRLIRLGAVHLRYFPTGRHGSKCLVLTGI